MKVAVDREDIGNGWIRVSHNDLSSVAITEDAALKRLARRVLEFGSLDNLPLQLKEYVKDAIDEQILDLQNKRKALQ